MTQRMIGTAGAAIYSLGAAAVFMFFVLLLHVSALQKQVAFEEGDETVRPGSALDAVVKRVPPPPLEGSLTCREDPRGDVKGGTVGPLTPPGWERADLVRLCVTDDSLFRIDMEVAEPYDPLFDITPQLGILASLSLTVGETSDRFSLVVKLVGTDLVGDMLSIRINKTVCAVPVYVELPRFIIDIPPTRFGGGRTVEVSAQVDYQSNGEYFVDDILAFRVQRR